MRVAPDARANSWEDVVDLAAAFGLVLDPWQEQVLQAAMGERTDGRWAAQQVGLSVSRQNGKSALVVARALAGALLFDERLIVVSAHEADTYRESTWTDLKNLIESSSALSSRIKPNGVMNAINRESVTFKNGARIKFKARTGSGGRGFSADCLLLDEAQMLPQRTWATIYSTQSARDNPQTWLTGTPPTLEDDPYAFKAMRDAALAGRTTRVAYLEWSSDVADDPALEATRARANPAWHTRINHDVVQGEFETYSPAQFAQERLGVWSSTLLQSVIHPAEWSRLAIPAEQVPAEGVIAVAVKFSADGERVACAVALRPDEGPVHVEALGVSALTQGVAPLVGWLAERWRGASQIVVDGKAGAGDLVNALVAAGVSRRRLRVVSTDEAVTAHASMLRAIREETVTHIGQSGLDAAVRVAGRRKIGTAGGWGWRSVTPEGDVTALDAVTLAHHAAVTSRRRSENRDGGDVVVL